MNSLPFICTLLFISGIIGSSVAAMLPRELHQHLMKHSKRAGESLLGHTLAEAEDSRTVEGSPARDIVAQAETRNQDAANHPGLESLPRLAPAEHDALALRATDGRQGNSIEASDPARFASEANHPSPSSPQYSGYTPESDNESRPVESKGLGQSSDPDRFTHQHNSEYQSAIMGSERAHRRNVFLSHHHDFSPEHHPDYDSDEYERRSWSHGVTTSEMEEIADMPMFDRDSDHSQSSSMNQDYFNRQHHSGSEQSDLSVSHGYFPRRIEESGRTSSASQGSDHSQHALASSASAVTTISPNAGRNSDDMSDTAASYPNKRFRFYARRL